MSWEWTNRASSALGFSKSLSGLDCGQGTGGAAIVGEGLDIDGLVAIVDDNGLVDGSGSTKDGTKGGKNSELHGGGLKLC